MTTPTGLGRSSYSVRLPNLATETLSGKLIVIEGPDGSGRSTQVRLLRERLEAAGYPTVEVGLKRSGLVGADLDAVMEGHTLMPLTLFLYYATDFADQLENVIVPALRSDFVVLADRYVYTLMARDIVRGADPAWLRDIYGFALKPDAIFYLMVPPDTLAIRNLQRDSSLDYWESGMDIDRKGDMYHCFIRYQTRIRTAFGQMKKEYAFREIDGNRPAEKVAADLWQRVRELVSKEEPHGKGKGSRQKA